MNFANHAHKLLITSCRYSLKRPVGPVQSFVSIGKGGVQI